MGTLPHPRAPSEPSADDVRAQLARLMASGSFPATARSRKLLEYVVEQTVAGRGERLKAYELAVSVLGRDQGFDPQSDTIVRVEMGRLRRNLDHYYMTVGRDDPVRITIPKGHYVPVFELREPAPTPKVATLSARQLTWPWPPRKAVAAGLCAIVLIAGIAIWAPWRASEMQATGPALI